MQGFGPMFVLIGCFILMNTYGKIKRNRIKFADSYKGTTVYRRKQKYTGEFREPRNKTREERKK